MPITYLKQDWIDREIGATAVRDRRGVYFHVFFGLFWCFLVAWPTSVVEFAGLGLVITGFARALYIHRTWRSVGCHPLMWLLACWALWQWFSISWSPDSKRGLHELGQNRWAWSIWMLWTVLPYRRWFIAAIVCGFFVGNLVQLGHAVGTHWHISWLTWPRLTDRNSGWWDPVVGGSLLCGALGLHLPCAVMGRGRMQVIAVCGAVVTVLAIIATGTRGAWIAGTLLVGGVLIVAFVRAARRRTIRTRSIAIGGAIALAAALLAWIFAGQTIWNRVERATDEIAGAIQRRDYSTDTGARIEMWIWAVREVRAHPLKGVGAGGYQAWAHQEMKREGLDPSRSRIHAHAHSAPLHIAATTGLVGLGLAGAAVMFGLRGAFRRLPGGIGSYDAGPGFAIIGLLLAGLFDPVQLNAQTAALLFVLLSLSILPRPTERAAQSAESP